MNFCAACPLNELNVCARPFRSDRIRYCIRSVEMCPCSHLTFVFFVAPLFSHLFGHSETDLVKICLVCSVWLIYVIPYDWTNEWSKRFVIWQDSLNGGQGIY